MSRDNIVLVTQNEHKITELLPLFKQYNVSFDTTSIEKLEIRDDDVKEIALVAAQQALKSLKRPVVVDDTGLYIRALNDFPAAYAAFVSYKIGNSGILKLMDDIHDRYAEFRTAVAYADAEVVKVFEGVMSGTIVEVPVGSGGFGYDPIFKPDGANMTYAELSLSAKVAISHRTLAFKVFLDWYTNTA